MLPDSTSSSPAVVRRIITTVLFFAAVSLSCFVLYRASNSVGLRFLNSFEPPPPSFTYVTSPVHEEAPQDSDEKNRLDRVLKDASMQNRTVIITTLNEAWAAPNSIVDLFLESFRIGDHTSRLLNHLVIIALDGKTFSHCVVVHTHCFALVTKGVDFSQEAYFMTPDYLKMMFVLIAIKLDADIMWFRDPFPRFYTDADFQIACDRYYGNPVDLVNNIPNGGFNFVKSNNRSIAFYKFWYSSRNTYPGLHDQDVLNKIKNDSFIMKIGLKMKFLNTVYFGGFCEPSKDFNQVCTMHANCCYGLDSKLQDLRIMLQDWKQFMSLPPYLKRSSMPSWRVPKNCSLDSLRHYHQPGKHVLQG
ncbi:hypothetical protein RJ639_007792 [Escallonia herrerae]|uniref:Nucleotide-diphospho-sugar transferase domain-containing protein n=1 Tax=Escallonia herrerae TaxID=1293975 RepID=A0AA88W2L3_9ASTE|nr:hypothetical protein RJ639_007792 [Escallonia herrerae]